MFSVAILVAAVAWAVFPGPELDPTHPGLASPSGARVTVESPRVGSSAGASIGGAVAPAPATRQAWPETLDWFRTHLER